MVFCFDGYDLFHSHFFMPWLSDKAPEIFKGLKEKRIT